MADKAIFLNNAKSEMLARKRANSETKIANLNAKKAKLEDEKQTPTLRRIVDLGNLVK